MPGLITSSVVSEATNTLDPTASVFSAKIKESIHKCDLCEFTSMSKHGVSVHMGHSHRKPSNLQDLESSLNEVIQQVDGNIEVEEEDQSEISNEVILKEAEVQTDPSFVTVEVKEVSKFYEIFVEESLKERIDEELESGYKLLGVF